MILYVWIFAVDLVVKFFLLIFYFSFLFEVFLVLVCLTLGVYILLLNCFCIFGSINMLILFYLWVILNYVYPCERIYLS